MEKNKLIDPVTVGKRLRILRGIRTRAEVEKETGMPQTRLGNYEHGYRYPKDDAKVLLANYYGVTVQQLFFEDDNHD